MKSKLLIRKIDFYVQIAALVISGVLVLWPRHYNTFVWVYLTVGLVQIISCIANAASRDTFSQHSSRNAYEKMLLIVAIVGGVSIIAIPIFYFYAIAMLILGPIMAVWYGYITYSEMKMIRIRVDRRQYV